jgi:hypothetical protein
MCCHLSILKPRSIRKKLQEKAVEATKQKEEKRKKPKPARNRKAKNIRGVIFKNRG